MRNISIQEFEQDPAACIAEVEAGQRLVLLRGGKAVVEIIPGSEAPLEKKVEEKSDQLLQTEERRIAAGAELMQILRKGYNLRGLKITDRDALYDRD